MPEPAVPTPRAERSDIDWRLLAPLLAHVVLVQVGVSVVRVTTSYRTLELDMPAAWLGAISAGFAILPIFLAVKVGRFIDEGNDAQAAWIGTGLILVASAALWLWPDSAVHLFAFTVILGTGHMFCMAAHQMLTVRSARKRARDTAFGHFMVAISVGQGLGPFIVGWMGGAATVPATGPLFTLGVSAAAVCFGVSLLIRPAPRDPARAETANVMPLRAIMRMPGMVPFMAASVVSVTALDLLVVYLPLLGAERGIDAGNIGLLLMVRSFAALVGRAFYTQMIMLFGRMPLTLATTFLAAGAFVLLAVPFLPVMYLAVVAIGVGLGVASTLTLTAIVDIAPPAARGTAMSLRITGNRLGLAFVPFLAGMIASAAGVAGILFLTAVTLSASAVGMHLSRRQAAGMDPPASV
jgi:predicted MFS family arabinose efflux permease